MSLKKIPVLWDVALYQWDKVFNVSKDSSVFIFRVTKPKKSSCARSYGFF
jgi:hypothetical protein